MASHAVAEIPDDLRYEDGDVIIQISEHPSGTFLVHSDVLCQSSHYFQAMFQSYGWSSSRAVKTEDGEVKKIWHLEMFFDREQGMCFLTDKVSSSSSACTKNEHVLTRCHSQIESVKTLTTNTLSNL